MSLAKVPLGSRPGPAAVDPSAAEAPDGGGRGLAARVRRLERAAGVYRPGRSPWVWAIGPGLNVAVTTVVVAWIGLASGLGWVATVPLALFCGAAMGLMAWAFMGTSWDQEEDERQAAEFLAREAVQQPPPTR